MPTALQMPEGSTCEDVVQKKDNTDAEQKQILNLWKNAHSLEASSFVMEGFNLQMGVTPLRVT